MSLSDSATAKDWHLRSYIFFLKWRQKIFCRRFWMQRLFFRVNIRMEFFLQCLILICQQQRSYHSRVTVDIPTNSHVIISAAIKKNMLFRRIFI